MVTVSSSGRLFTAWSAGLVLLLATVTVEARHVHMRPKAMAFRAAVDSDKKNPLIYAQVMFRHGDRAPNAFWKKDPFANSFPQGAGQLTTRGWEQQYALGQFLRSRYSEYLNLDTTGLSYADVYVRSTDVERAIASVQANTAAFFRPPSISSKKPDSVKSPNAAELAWETPNSDLNKLWQPVPIHTVPEKDDWVMHQADCPQLDLQKKKFENTQEVQELKRTSAVQALFRGLTFITGEPLDSWTISKTFKSLADTLYCEQTHGLILPKVPREFYDAIEELRERTWVMPYADKETAQLRGGCILDTLVQNMRNKLDRTNAPTTEKPKKGDPYSSRKLVIFSGHDTSLLGLISAAGLLEKIWAKPPYASSIYFELYADGMVEISYKNDTSTLNAIRTSQPVSMLKAPLTELESMWKDVRVNEVEYQKKCQVQTTSDGADEDRDAKPRILSDEVEDDDTGED